MTEDNIGRLRGQLPCIFFIHFICSFFPYLFQEESLRSYIYINYSLQVICIFIYSLVVRSQSKFFLSPSILSSLYLLVSFILADLLFRNDIYILEYQYVIYSSWEHIRLSLLYYNLCTYLLCISYFATRPIFFKNVFSSYQEIGTTIKSFIFLSALLVIILVTNVSISLPGGGIDFSTIFSTILAICLFVRIHKIQSLYRFLLYVLIIGLFAIFKFNNKREAIFLVFPILLLELSSIKYKLFSFKMFLKLSLICISMFVLIIYMSIMRRNQGNDNLTIAEITDIIPAIIEYISIDNVLPILADNIEVNYVYINSHYAVELITNEPELKTWGSTYIKPFFVFVPRTIFPEKPEGVITLYSKAAVPKAAANGYCLPLSIHAEAYWNFGFYGGLIAVFFIFCLLNSLYKYFYLSITYNSSLANVLYLYCFYVFFILYRDAGFEKVVIWIPVAIVLLYILIFAFKNKQVHR